MTHSNATDLSLIELLRAHRAAPIVPRLPSAGAIDAALEMQRESAQRAVETTHRADKDERRFWTAQRNAYVNAQADRASGRTAMADGAGFLVPSSRTPGMFYRLSLTDGIWQCSCEAADNGRFCRHAAQITAIEVADVLEQQEAANRLPFEQPADEFAGLLDEPERYGAGEFDDLSDLFYN